MGNYKWEYKNSLLFIQPKLKHCETTGRIGIMFQGKMSNWLSDLFKIHAASLIDLTTSQII